MKEELFKEKSRYITGFVLIIVAGFKLSADNLKPATMIKTNPVM
ncbi:hypothetical protein TH0274_17370 [Helicobacter pylori]